MSSPSSVQMDPETRRTTLDLYRGATLRDVRNIDAGGSAFDRVRHSLPGMNDVGECRRPCRAQYLSFSFLPLNAADHVVPSTTPPPSSP